MTLALITKICHVSATLSTRDPTFTPRPPETVLFFDTCLRQAQLHSDLTRNK